MRWWEKLDGVYEVETDLGTELWQAALKEVEQCNHRLSLDTEFVPGLDTVEVVVNGDATNQVLDYFKSDMFYQRVADLCNSDQEWYVNWAQPSVAWLRKHTRFDHVWHGAPPNYTRHEWHVDCLRTVIHGMMYLSSGNDATATTLFKVDDREIAMTTGFDRGWIILQNGRQTHRGINLNPTYRYTFKWMLTLNI